MPAVENTHLSGTIRALGNNVEDFPHDRGIDEVQITPDGKHVIYLADDDFDTVHELYTVPVEGGIAPKKIHAPLAPPEGSKADALVFKISSDSEFVVFSISKKGDLEAELWAAPADGSGDAYRLRPENQPGVAMFRITPDDTPDGKTVVFSGFSEADGDWRLYSVPIDARRPPDQLSLGPVWNRSSGKPHDNWQISPDSRQVVYVTGRGSDEPHHQVFKAQIGVANSEIGLDTDPDRDDAIDNLSISPDSQSVVYSGKRFTDQIDLISVPINGGTARVIHFDNKYCDCVRTVATAKEGNRIAYTTYNSQLWRLYTIQMGGNATQTLLYNGQVDDFEFTPDGERVIYDTGDKLYSISSSGPIGSEILLADAHGQIDSFKIHPNGEWVTFLGDLDTSDIEEIYTVSIHGGVPAKLHRPRTDNQRDFSIDGYKISVDGSRIVFLGTSETGDGIRLFSAPARPAADGSLEVELSGDLPVSGLVENYQDHFEIAPDGNRVVFAADRRRDDVVELFSVDSSGGESVRLNRGYAPVGDVSQVWPSPNSQWAVYRANFEEDQRFDLYAVPTDPTHVNEIENPISTFRHGDDVIFAQDIDSPDHQRVFFLGSSAGSPEAKLFYSDLAEGETGERMLLSPDQANVHKKSSVHTFRLHPDGESAVYLADHRAGKELELYQVHVDDPTQHDRLGPEIPGSAEIRDDFEITAGGSAVVFSGDVETDNKFELFTVSLDSPSPSFTNLSQMPQDRSVAEKGFQLAKERQAVVFHANRENSSKKELYLVELDPPSTPVKVSGDSASSVENDFLVTGSEGNGVIFRTGSADELFSADLTAPGSDPVKLHSAVVDFAVSPDGSQVAFRAKNPDSGETELFLRGVAAQDLAKVVSPPSQHSRHEISLGYTFSPDGNWLVFRSDAREDDVPDLYKVSTADGGPAVMVTPENAIGSGVVSFAISPDSYRLSYRIDTDGSDRIEMFSVPLVGGEDPRRLNTEFGPFTDVSATISFLPDSSQLLFTDDRRKDETLELYTAYELPTVTEIADQFVLVNGIAGPLPFSVYDLETRPTEIQVTTVSDDQTLIPDANLVITGSGAERQITVTPAPDSAGGPVTITLSVEAKGEIVTETFTVTVGTDGNDEYRHWLEKYFDQSDLDDPAQQATLWGTGADPDKDGLSNLLEWGKGLDPSQADRSTDTFYAEVDGNILTLTYRRPKPTPATLQTSFESSPDLSENSWLPLQPEGDAVTITDLGNAEIVQRRFQLPTPIRDQTYARGVYTRAPGP